MKTKNQKSGTIWEVNRTVRRIPCNKEIFWQLASAAKPDEQIILRNYELQCDQPGNQVGNDGIPKLQRYGNVLAGCKISDVCRLG